MESMNISLPEPLSTLAGSPIALGRYSNAGECVRELVRADEKHRVGEQFKALLLAGVKGKGQGWTRIDWQRICQHATAQVRAHRVSAAATDRVIARQRA